MTARSWHPCEFLKGLMRFGAALSVEGVLVSGVLAVGLVPGIVAAHNSFVAAHAGKAPAAPAP